MIEVSIPMVWAIFIAGYFIGVLAIELDLRRSLKKNSSVVPMLFGKNVIIKETK